ncbi:DNA cytosine methyltransferase [Escherichia coli]
MNYYNEWDKGAAAWLRELIKQGHIPFGVVDERSITEVKPEDLDGFTQCHFFAGIGGWPLALRLAGVPEDAPLWTGSPPCQPFSAAGKQLGQFDPRHLAPVFLDLISECRPPVLFGEQVAPAIAKSWMCDLQTHLEGENYAVGFAVLPACSVGAPHKRDRLFFGAHRLAHASGITDNKRREHAQHRRQDETEQTGVGRRDDGMGDADRERLQRKRRDSDSQGRKGPDFRQAGLLNGAGTENIATNPHHGFWSEADWLGCRDGKFRPVEPGTFPLADGIPARVGRLRGYGNAIVPQVAAEFIKAFMGAVNE